MDLLINWGVFVGEAYKILPIPRLIELLRIMEFQKFPQKVNCVKNARRQSGAWS